MKSKGGLFAALVVAVSLTLTLSQVVRAAATFTMFAGSVWVPVGVSVDTNRNVWVTSTSADGFSDVLTKYAPNGAILSQSSARDFDLSGSKLATDRATGRIWEMVSTGAVNWINPDTGGRTFVLNLRTFGVDTSRIYDLAAGTTGPQAGVIVPSSSRYGDIAVLRRGNRLDLFVSAFSVAHPWVARIRMNGDTVESAKAVVTSLATNAPNNNIPRGIAVNQFGTVLTVLPALGSGGVGTVDQAVAFHADFSEGIGFSPFIALNRQAFAADGMAADGDGYFFVAARVETELCSFTTGLVIITPLLDQAGCYSDLGPRFRDVAVSQDGNLAYMTAHSNTTDGRVWLLNQGFADTTPPAPPTLTLGETEPDEHASGTTLYYNPATGNSGTFTVDAAASDPESGIDLVGFPVVFGGDGGNVAAPPYRRTYSWSAGATAAGAKTVTATNRAGLTSSSAFTVTPDTAGPATVAITAPATDQTVANGATVAANASDALSGVAKVEFRACAGETCGFGAAQPVGIDTTAPYSVDWNGQPADGPATLVARATDNVGNTTDAAPVTVIVDNVPNDDTPPTGPTLTLAEVGPDDPDQHVSDSTLYYNPSGGRAGTFEVAAAAADPQSGIASVAFPPVFGADGATDTTGPAYQQSYSWTAAATAAGAKQVTATNGAGLSSASSFTVTPDTVRPTVALTAPAAGATVGNGDAVAANADDSLSGVARVEFRYCDTAGCDFDDGLPIDADSAAPFAVTWTGQPPDGEYSLVARATDRVGNTSDAAPRTVTVANTPPDDTPPTNPALTLIEGEPDEHADNASRTLYYNPSSAGGAFTVTAATSDPQSGIASVAFPDVFGGDGTTDTSGPAYEHRYSWSAGAGAPGARQVTATNGAGLAAASTFTVAADATNPTAAITAPRANARVRAGQVIRVTATDAGSGVARVVVRYCPGTRCAFARANPIGTDSAAPFQVVWNRQPPAGTYTLVAQATDNVGRRTTSAPVTVTVGAGARAAADAVAPEVALTAPVAGSELAGNVVLSAEAADDGSGVARVAFQIRPVGGDEWVTLAERRDAPYARRVDLGELPDGAYAMRALVVDGAGNTVASAPVRVTVAKDPARAGGARPTGGDDAVPPVESTADAADASEEERTAPPEPRERRRGG